MILGYKGTHIVAMPPFEGVKTYATKDFEKKLDLHLKDPRCTSDAWLHGCSLVWLLYLGHGFFLDGLNPIRKKYDSNGIISPAQVVKHLQ